MIQPESLLHRREQAVGNICFHVNAYKTKFMLLKQGAVFTPSGNPLKLIEQFTYIGCNILSTENDVQHRHREGIE